MQKPRTFDVVKLRAAIAGHGLDDEMSEVVVPEGEEGTIVEEFERPDEAYLIEFVDRYGEVVAMVTARADQFDVVWRADSATVEVGA